MDRTEKKCFIAAAGFHLLLLMILFVGPAFLSSRNPADDLPVLDFIPARLVDAPFSGGGNPKASQPPAPVPPQPQVQPPAPQPPQPVKVEAPKPEPKVEKTSEPKIEKTETKSLEKDPLATKPSKKKIEVSTELVKRSADPKATAKAQAEARAADEKRRSAALAAIKSTVRGIRENAASSTSVDIPGPGGEAYANYAQVVKSIYTHAWIAPDDAASDTATVRVSVTIARDGRVISGRIIDASGDNLLDRSIQRTLDRVTFVAPFPAGAKEEQRTFTIKFNLQAKRLLG